MRRRGNRNITVHERHLLRWWLLLLLLLLGREEHGSMRQLSARRHHDEHHLAHGRRRHPGRCHTVLGHCAAIRHRVRHHCRLLLLCLLRDRHWRVVVDDRLWWGVAPLLLRRQGCIGARACCGTLLLQCTPGLVPLQLLLELLCGHPCTLCKTSVGDEGRNKTKDE